MMIWLAKAWVFLKLNTKMALIGTASVLTAVFGIIFYVTGQKRQVALLKAKLAVSQAENDISKLRARQEVDSEMLKQNHELKAKLDQDFLALENTRNQLKAQVLKLSTDEVVDEFNKRGY